MQLKRLVNALNTDYCIFLIYIDAKLPVWPFTRLFTDYSPGKVFFCPNRKSIYWGRYSMLEATMGMLEFFFKLDLKAEYFHLLSGQDYPIKSNNDILAFFKKNNGTNFIDYSLLSEKKWNISLERITHKWWLNEEQSGAYSDITFYEKKRTSLKQLPDNFKLYGGSQWWSIHIECITYIYSLYTSNKNLFESFRFAYIPDELLFQVLILNSKFKHTTENNNLRFIEWSEGAAHPKLINYKSFDILKKCKDKLFARKFNNSSIKILDKIDEENNNKTACFSSKIRNCVISAVGKNSVHHNWINKDYKQFDLHLIVYDNSLKRYKDDTDNISQAKGYKLKLIYDYIQKKRILDEYDYFFFPDDDILIDYNGITTLFSTMWEYNLAIAQPALIHSYYSYPHTLKQENSQLRYTNFIEMMTPCFSQDALKRLLFTFNENSSGWGADYHWGELVNYKNYNMAIIDSTTAVHTRPIQSQNKKNREDLSDYIQKYSLQNVRIIML